MSSYGSVFASAVLEEENEEEERSATTGRTLIFFFMRLLSSPVAFFDVTSRDQIMNVTRLVSVSLYSKVIMQ